MFSQLTRVDVQIFLPPIAASGHTNQYMQNFVTDINIMYKHLSIWKLFLDSCEWWTDESSYWVHSPGLPTAFGWGDCGGWFGCSRLDTGFLVGHCQHLPLLLGQFSRNRGVLNAGADTTDRREKYILLAEVYSCGSIVRQNEYK